MTEWSEFTEGLTETLATLPSGAAVIIAEPGPWSDRVRFTQFFQYDAFVHAELPGDRWLDPAVQAGPDGGRMLVDDGWREPHADFGWNWWTELLWPARSDQYRRLASMMVTALRDVFGIPDPDGLEYYAWNENAGNAPLELPRLGLPFNSSK